MTEIRSKPEEVIPVDLVRLAQSSPGKKPAWSQQGEDMSINLVSFTAGQETARHINTEVDVLMVGVHGKGAVEIDGHWYALLPSQLIVVPKGVQRAARCDGDVFAYLSCHRRRMGLQPKPRTAPIDEAGTSGGRS